MKIKKVAYVISVLTYVFLTRPLFLSCAEDVVGSVTNLHAYSDMIAAADEATQFRQYDMAEKLFAKAIALRPDEYTAYGKLGWCLIKQEKYDAAEETFLFTYTYFHDVPNSDVDQVYIILDYAWILAQQEKYAEATIIYEHALKIAPNNPDCYLRFSECLEARSGKILERATPLLSPPLLIRYKLDRGLYSQSSSLSTQATLPRASLEKYNQYFLLMKKIIEREKELFDSYVFTLADSNEQIRQGKTQKFVLYDQNREKWIFKIHGDEYSHVARNVLVYRLNALFDVATPETHLTSLNINGTKKSAL